MIEKVFREILEEKMIHFYWQFPVTIQNVFVSLRGWTLRHTRYSGAYWTTLRFLLNSQKWDKEKMEQYQLSTLKKTLLYAKETTSYYREIMGKLNLHPEDLQSPSDLKQLPILERHHIRDYLTFLLSGSIKKKDIVFLRTSGTSGSPILFGVDKEAFAVNNAFIMRHLIWAGFKPGEWRITIYGRKIVPPRLATPPFWRINYPGKQFLLSIYHLSYSTLPYYLDFLKEHQGLLLEGYPTALYLLAQYLYSRGEKVHMKAIYTTGEPLYPHMRQIIEEVFQTSIFDGYGFGEMGGLIQQCEFGSYHQISEYGVLEILDDEGKECAPGQVGYLVWTGFINKAMPLIRYRVGDLGSWSTEKCPCGRPYPCVELIGMRSGDYLYLPDGRILTPRALSIVVHSIENISTAQFVQSSPSHIDLYIVPLPAFNENDKKTLLSKVKEIISPMSVDLQITDKPIFIGSRGKIPLIIQKWKKQQLTNT